MSKVRVAVAGFGIGEKSARAALRSEVAELVAVCDADPAKGESLVKLVTEEKSDAKPMFATGETAFSDLMAWGEFDALVVAFPNYLHRMAVEAALEAGKHVLCEKPLAHTFEDALAMTESAAKHHDLVAAMTMNNLARPEFAIIQEVLLPQIGDIKYVEGEWTRRQGYPFRGRWFSDKSKIRGGPVIDLGPHVLGLVFALCDWPGDISVQRGYTWCSDWVQDGAWDGPYGGGATGPGVCDVESAAHALIEVGSVPCDIKVAWGMPTYREYMGIEIIGSKGSINFTRSWPINDGDDEKSRDALTAALMVKGPSGKYLTQDVIMNPDDCPGWQDPWMGRLTYAEWFFRSVAGDTDVDIIGFERALQIQEAIRDWYASAG